LKLKHSINCKTIGMKLTCIREINGMKLEIS